LSTPGAKFFASATIRWLYRSIWRCEVSEVGGGLRPPMKGGAEESSTTKAQRAQRFFWSRPCLSACGGTSGRSSRIEPPMNTDERGWGSSSMVGIG
jgi:hypothetical protein